MIVILTEGLELTIEAENQGDLLQLESLESDLHCTGITHSSCKYIGGNKYPQIAITLNS